MAFADDRIPSGDIEILRELGRRRAELAALPVNAERADLWRRLNRLERLRPLIWINEIPWGEMNVNGELDLECRDPWCRRIEWDLRETEYRWKHLNVDMVVSPALYSPIVFHDSGYGLVQETDNPDHWFGAKAFKPLIHSERDVEKIRNPVITPDPAETERLFNRMRGVFDRVLPVARRGVTSNLCAPWDYLVSVYGVEKLLSDMIDEPGLVHACVRRFMEAAHARLDQLESFRLLTLGDGNHMVGTSSLAFSDQLPRMGDPGAPSPARARDQWGYAMSQIFYGVSPDMHEEFALDYERGFLERFGLSGYGCCDPLHDKIRILRKVRNLRMISMSAWINVEKAAENMGADFVFAYKPNPAIVAMESWNPCLAERELRNVFERTRGCRVAAVLKDISTVNRDPKRLWDWCEMAMRVAREYP